MKDASIKEHVLTWVRVLIVSGLFEFSLIHLILSADEMFSVSTPSSHCFLKVTPQQMKVAKKTKEMMTDPRIGRDQHAPSTSTVLKWRE